jgi:hypothetical protein
VVNRFVSFRRGATDDFERLWNVYRATGRLPANLAAIAVDPFGNLICLGTGEPDAGAIFFWDHERELMKDGSAVSFIADSFSAFLKALVPFSEYDVPADVPQDIQQILEDNDDE